MPARVLKVEQTPNPNARKFICSSSLSPQRLSRFDAASASDHPLTRAIFQTPGVQAVMVLGDFLTVTKSPDAKWPEIVAAVKAAVEQTTAT